MTNPSDLAILILAAGESKRMGEPKQLLPWKNTTLLGHTISIAKSVLAENVHVVLGGNFERVNKISELKGVNVIYNSNYKLGQGSSLSNGINHLLENENNFNAVLVMLCDQPLISTAYLKELTKVFYNSEQGIIATNYQNRAGVPVIFDKKYFQELIKIKGDKGAKDIIRKNFKDLIIVNADGKEVDLDTTEEYKSLKNILKF